MVPFSCSEYTLGLPFPGVQSALEEEGVGKISLSESWRQLCKCLNFHLFERILKEDEAAATQNTIMKDEMEMLKNIELLKILIIEISRVILFLYSLWMLKY